jgi:hypothetical protein
VKIKTFVAEGTLTLPTSIITTGLFTQSHLVAPNQFILLLLVVHPVATGADKVRGNPALRTSSNGFVIELPFLPPTTDAGKAENVVARREDPETLFPGRIL